MSRSVSPHERQLEPEDENAQFGRPEKGGDLMGGSGWWALGWSFCASGTMTVCPFGSYLLKADVKKDRQLLVPRLVCNAYFRHRVPAVWHQSSCGMAVVVSVSAVSMVKCSREPALHRLCLILAKVRLVTSCYVIIE